MKHVVNFLSLGAGIAVLSFFSACSSGSGTPTATAGAGNTETGGATGNAGSGNTTAGSANVGGHTGTGGTSGASTSPGSTGGTTSTGSTLVIDSFDTQQEQALFQPNTVIPTDCSINVAAANDAGGTFTVGWSGSVDINVDANPKGSMKVVATFTNWDQKWAVEMPAPTDNNGNIIDLSNKIVSAELEATAGLSTSSTYEFGAVIYMKTGSSYVWGASAWTNIGALKFVANSLVGYDQSSRRAVRRHLRSHGSQADWYPI